MSLAGYCYMIIVSRSLCIIINFQGDVNNYQILEFGAAYDYITNTDAHLSSNSTGSRAVLHKETVPYHSTGPSASVSEKPSSATKAGQPSHSSVYSDNVYEAPIAQKFRVSKVIHCNHGTNFFLNV